MHQLHLDQDRDVRQTLENQQVRDALQQEVNAMRTLLDRNSYVTVLIDGDALTFAKEYVSKGSQGGKDVACSIHDAVKHFANEVLPNMGQFQVHVKLFADIRGLSESLVRSKHVDKITTFESFLTGLMSSDIQVMLVDVIDTSLLKGLTTKKLQEAYRHEFTNVHCHQIFLAATANPELNDLLDELPEIPVHERVTLLDIRGLSTNDQFQHEISSIKLNVPLIKVPSENPAILASSKMSSPMLARIPSSSSTRTMNSAPATLSAGSTPQLSWAAMTAQPFVPKATDTKSGVLTPVSMNTPPLVKATIVEVPRNKYGQRVDPVDITIPYQELQRIKKMKLCNIYYLVGKNECSGNCGHSHTYALSKSEKNILKEVARMTACHNRTDCDDIGCIYGHRCPQNKPDRKDCYYKGDCRFTGWGHGIDETVVKTRSIK